MAANTAAVPISANTGGAHFEHFAAGALDKAIQADLAKYGCEPGSAQIISTIFCKRNLDSTIKLIKEDTEPEAILAKVMAFFKEATAKTKEVPTVGYAVELALLTGKKHEADHKAAQRLVYMVASKHLGYQTRWTETNKDTPVFYDSSQHLFGVMANGQYTGKTPMAVAAQAGSQHVKKMQPAAKKVKKALTNAPSTKGGGGKASRGSKKASGKHQKKKPHDGKNTKKKRKRKMPVTPPHDEDEEEEGAKKGKARKVDPEAVQLDQLTRKAVRQFIGNHSAIKAQMKILPQNRREEVLQKLATHKAVVQIKEDMVEAQREAQLKEQREQQVMKAIYQAADNAVVVPSNGTKAADRPADAAARKNWSSDEEDSETEEDEDSEEDEDEDGSEEDEDSEDEDSD